MSKVENEKKDIETPKKPTAESKKKTPSKAKTEADKTNTKKTTPNKTASNKTTTKKTTEKKATQKKVGDKTGKTTVAKESKVNKDDNQNKEKVVKKTTKKTVKKDDIKEETEKSTKKEVQKESDNRIKKENDKKEKDELIEKKTLALEETVDEDISEDVSEDIEEDKEKTISLKDIKTVLKNKVSNVQKRSLFKEELINIGSAVFMIFHLLILYMGSKNIELNILINDMKIITICILAIGIGILEFSYKKDEIKIALRGLEVLVFGASNLCLIYVARLYFNEVVHFIIYIGAVLVVYYIVKIIITSIYNVRKYKKDNNDIKDIVKK